MSGAREDFNEDQAAEFAAYVASLTAELSRLARRHRLSTLAYLLEMSRMEARGIAQPPPLGKTQEARE
ncbi:MAG: hypothetical protein B7Z41_06780 [Rhizobiales bacterium 12-66-7]|jgi:hypothetical protein|nr:MAG: hypothetical protein B7Z41_06780 [Rhizobiales bacterium 12-66-7]OYX74705.1 MAG: hypothetical protein B7Y95_05600 [Rhizobiales bacterium 32-66-11]